MSRKREADTLTVDRKEFADALRSLKPIVKSAGNAILRGVLMRSVSRPDGEFLTISATNMGNTLSLEIARQGGPEDFLVLVDLGRLEGFASADWGEELSLTLGRGRAGRLEVEGRTTARFVVEPPENYPEPPTPPAERPGEVALPYVVVEEIGRARPFINTDAKVYGGWQKVLHLFEREGRVEVFAGSGHRAWWRQGLVESPGFAVGLTPETAALLVAQAGKAGFSVWSGERQDFFAGPGYLLSQTRPEHEGLPLGWLTDTGMQPEAWQEMPRLGVVLPVVEAVSLEAGERSPLLLTEDGDKMLASTKSDLVDREGVIPGRLPIYKTGYPDDLLAILRELDRVAGAERPVEVGRFGHGHLRFRVAGVAEALVSGMQ